MWNEDLLGKREDYEMSKEEIEEDKKKWGAYRAKAEEHRYVRNVSQDRDQDSDQDSISLLDIIPLIFWG